MKLTSTIALSIQLGHSIASPVAPSSILYSAKIQKRHCGLAEWDSTDVSNWAAADTDNWLREWWSTYKSNDSAAGLLSGILQGLGDLNNANGNFVNMFGRMYLNNAEVYKCAGLDDVCFGDIDCSELHCAQTWFLSCPSDPDAGSPVDSLRPVYMVMRALQGMQTYFGDMNHAFDQATIDFQGISAWLVTAFNPKPDITTTLFIKDFVQALSPTLAIAASSAKLLKALGIKDSNLKKESIGAAGQIASAGAFIGANGVLFPSDDSFQEWADLSSYMTKASEGIQKGLSDMQYNLAVGNDYNGKNFPDYAQGGVFLDEVSAASADGSSEDAPIDQTRDIFTRQMTARAINFLWRQRKIYITYTTDVDGSCEDDQQGPQDMKYCRPGDSGVYYLYWWHQKAAFPFISDSFESGKLDHPTGWDQLGAAWNNSGNPLSLTDVFESSIAAYYAAGFSYEQSAVDRVVEAMTGEWSPSPFDAGASWEGTFTIPVCNTGNTSYNVQLGDRIMPCGCGPNGDGTQVNDFRNNANMNGYGVYDDRCTAEMQSSRSRQRHQSEGSTGGDGPTLPTNANQIECLTTDATKDMVSDITDCEGAIAALGSDSSKQICANECVDSGSTPEYDWCRVATGPGKKCSFVLSAKSKTLGGLLEDVCVTVGAAQKFLANAEATTDNGGIGCHTVGTTDFAATFLTPDGMGRWCLSASAHADYCSV